jgi:hypothetical protein
VQMAGMRSILIPVTQSGSGASRRHSAAHVKRGMANSFLQEIVSLRLTPAQAIAGQGIVQVPIAALDLTTKDGRGGDMWAATSGAKKEVVTADADTIRQTGKWVDLGDVHAPTNVPARDSKQTYIM